MDKSELDILNKVISMIEPLEQEVKFKRRDWIELFDLKDQLQMIADKYKEKA